MKRFNTLAALLAAALLAPSFAGCSSSPERVRVERRALKLPPVLAGGFGPAQGNSPTGYSSSGGVVTITDALNVGTTTDAAASGDASFGLTGAGRFTYDQSAGTVDVYNGSGVLSARYSISSGWALASNRSLSWSSSTAANGTADLRLERQAAGTLNVSDPSNTSPGMVRLYDAAGTSWDGIQNNPSGLSFYHDGSQFLVLNSSGHLRAITADAQDLGTTALEWRSLYLGDAGGIYFGLAQDVFLERQAAGALRISDPTNSAAGRLDLYNSAGTEVVVLHQGASGAGVTLGSVNALRWSSATAANSGTYDVVLDRDAAGVLALKDATAVNDSVLRVYDSAGTNYVSITHETSNALFDTSTGSIQFGRTVTPDAVGGPALGITSNPWNGCYLGNATGVVVLHSDASADGVVTVKDPNGATDAELRVYNAASSSYASLSINGTNASLNIGGTQRLQFNSAALNPNGNLTLGTTGAPWSDAHIARSANLALLTIKSATQELTGLSGASASTTNLVPAGCRILYVVARVTTLVEGATTFDVGDGSDVDRYGAAIALAAGTTVDETDSTADPMSWSASAQDVTLTANGSNFTAGAVRITAFYLDPTPPGS